MLYLYESQRLEVLADLFVDRMTGWAREGRVDPLRPEILIPQNPVIGRWLTYRISGQTGVCANLAFPLAGRFIRDLIERVYGNSRHPVHFDKETLLLRLFESLPGLLSLPSFAEVRGFLGRGIPEKRLYELSALLADLFDRSMIYRPSLLLAWEDGAEPEGWPAILWRHLAGGSRPLHRARMMEAYFQNGGRELAGLLPPRLSLFGLTGMAPVDLRFFRTLGERGLCEIHFYFQNPCEEYWGDIVSARMRDQAPSGQEVYLETGNPLLSSWGEQFRVLHQSLSDLPETERMFPPAPETLLGGLQEDIRTLSDRGARVREKALEKMTIPLRDRSIEVVCCSSPVREIEMLRDRLLGLFSEIPGLSPEDVVVLAPDIGRYTGIIRSVFGAPVRGAGVDGGDPEIPFVISDRRELLEEPPFEALLLLLRLPSVRLTAPLIFLLLSVPAIARKFGLEELRPARLQEILQGSGIRWGRSGSDRPAPYAGRNENTVAEGRTRLLLGYACGEERLSKTGGGPDPLFLPEDPDGFIVGSIAAFFETLDDHIDTLSGTRPADQWPDRLRTILEDFFDLDLDRGLDRELLALPERLARGFSEAGTTVNLSSGVLARHLERMAGAGEGSDRFFSGGVTFGRMVPLRSIPFRVVCLVGMNDADFPRPSWPPSFDWLVASPQPGDRSVRDDDRTLFLEALLSARDRLWISYVGIESRDGSSREPSVLVRELMDHLSEGYSGEMAPISTQITLAAPIDPLSPEHYSRDADPRLKSYSRSWRLALDTAWGAPARERVFFDPRLSWSSRGSEESSFGREGLAVSDLREFIRDPVRYFLVRQMGLPHSDRTLLLEEDEPFGVDEKRLASGRLRGKLSWESELPWPPLRSLARERIEADIALYRRTMSERTGVSLPESPGSVPMEGLDGVFHGVRLYGSIEGLCQGPGKGRILLVERWPRMPYPSDFLESFLLHLLSSLFVEGYEGCLLTGRGGKREGEKDPSRIPVGFWRWDLLPKEVAARHFLSYLRAFRKGSLSPLPFDPEASLTYAREHEKSRQSGALPASLSSGSPADRARAMIRAARLPPFSARNSFFDPRRRSTFWSALAFSGRDLAGEPAFALWSLRLFRPLLSGLTEEGAS